METQVIAASPADAGLGRYRNTEAALWNHYGLVPSERFIEVGSPRTRLRVVESGAGEPVLFIGGTGGTGPYWGPLIRELQGLRCLMLDRPGWGLSTPVDYSRQRYGTFVADLLRDTLDALGVERAHVVGASIGDVWALRLAQRHPDRVGRVVLLGGGPVTSEIKPPGFIRLLASPVGALIVRIPQKPDRVRSILRQIGHGPSLDAGRIPEAFVNWRVAFERETGAMLHERSMVRAIVAGRDFRPGLRFEDQELSTIRHHTLMVFGSADEVGTTDVWRRAMATMPNGQLRVVDRAGHMPWFDDAGGVGGAVRQFLTSWWSRPWHQRLAMQAAEAEAHRGGAVRRRSGVKLGAVCSGSHSGGHNAEAGRLRRRTLRRATSTASHQGSWRNRPREDPGRAPTKAALNRSA